MINQEILYTSPEHMTLDELLTLTKLLQKVSTTYHGNGVRQTMLDVEVDVLKEAYHIILDTAKNTEPFYNLLDEIK